MAVTNCIQISLEVIAIQSCRALSFSNWRNPHSWNLSENSYESCIRERYEL